MKVNIEILNYMEAFGEYCIKNPEKISEITKTLDKNWDKRTIEEYISELLINDYLVIWNREPSCKKVFPNFNYSEYFYYFIKKI